MVSRRKKIGVLEFLSWSRVAVEVMAVTAAVHSRKVVLSALRPGKLKGGFAIPGLRPCSAEKSPGKAGAFCGHSIEAGGRSWPDQPPSHINQRQLAGTHDGEPSVASYSHVHTTEPPVVVGVKVRSNRSLPLY